MLLIPVMLLGECLHVIDTSYVTFSTVRLHSTFFFFQEICVYIFHAVVDSLALSSLPHH
jgi:hypothetical protein